MITDHAAKKQKFSQFKFMESLWKFAAFLSGYKMIARSQMMVATYGTMTTGKMY